MKHIVVDLEMNNVAKGSEARQICSMETIEIGAVMLDDDLKEISSFRSYVKPEYNTEITAKITRLTGITYEMVTDAPVFGEALHAFTEWCGSSGDEVTIYAWSGSDFGQVKKEIQLKKYNVSEKEQELLQKPWSDFQREFDTYLGFERHLSLKVALEMAGVDFTGKEHDALDDARNTAELLHIFRDEKLFDQTLRKIKEVMEPSSIGSTLGDMIDFSAFM